MSVDFVHIRHQLHQIAELSGQEKVTAEYIEKQLLKFQADSFLRIANHSLIGFYGLKNDGPLILFRCELDALPIDEGKTLGYASNHHGVSHKCGHDGHMTIMLRLAFMISQKPIEGIRIGLLFQEAEETGQGAKAVVESNEWKKLDIDAIFSLHNLPGYPKHQIILSQSQFSATVQSVCIRFSGMVAHAAFPEKGKNPALQIADIIQWMKERENLDTRHPGFCQITPIYIKVGTLNYGIAAGHGEAHFTIRTWSIGEMNKIEEEINAFINLTSRKYGISSDIEWSEYFPSVTNDPAKVRLVEAAANDIGLQTIVQNRTCRFGEDFGWFTKELKGAMFGLGSGLRCHPLHHNAYDFPDDIIKSGSEIFYQIARFYSQSIT